MSLTRDTPTFFCVRCTHPPSNPSCLRCFEVKLPQDREPVLESEAGAHANIYSLEDARGRKFALKRLRAGNQQAVDEIERGIEREATTWKKFDHMFILPFLGVHSIGRRTYLVSPFTSNGTLNKYLEDNPESPDRIRLLKESAQAIAYLHSKTFLHGDIKGNNILVSDCVHALVCDFGLCRLVDRATSRALKGTGTTRWEAPEMWKRGTNSKTKKTDVYSFGITVAEILSGEIPYKDIVSNPEVVLAVVQGDRPPRDPSACPVTKKSYDSVWDIAERCWSPQATARPTIGEVVIDLEKAEQLVRG
ncbi:hypothetical protein FRB99_003042 [Tulasnella sp. 403]|nr:hypothetical protein FRB99_003042 [Tulasnella sp. 403]